MLHLTDTHSAKNVSTILSAIRLHWEMIRYSHKREYFLIYLLCVFKYLLLYLMENSAENSAVCCSHAELMFCDANVKIGGKVLWNRVFPLTVFAI